MDVIQHAYEQHRVHIFPSFIAMWIFISYMIPKKGWAELVEHFKFEEQFHGNRIGIISASINSVNYQNALIMKYNDKGVYLNSTILFRFFHRAVFIPYSAIVQVREKKVFFSRFNDIIVGNPYIATIKINTRTYNRIRDSVEKHLKKGV